MRPIVVFLPGIMGSSLGETWSANMVRSLKNVVEDPWSIKLPARERDSSSKDSLHFDCQVMGEVRIWRYPRPICQRLRNRLNAQNKEGNISFYEFGYDWRHNIIKTSRRFGEWLRQTVSSFGHDKPAGITIVAHSMGCLVASIAIIEGHIDRTVLQNLICVGGPFVGAPTAFRALYSTGYLPGIDWLDKLIQPRTNRIATVSAILDAFQSFPSLYQLLPPQDQKFVWKDGKIISPLQDSIIPDWAKKAADEVHSRLREVETFFERNNIPVSLIYGIEPKMSLKFVFKDSQVAQDDSQIIGDTDQEYGTSLGRNALFKQTYANVRVVKQTAGDGTVPAHSAAISDKDTLDKYMIPGVQHSYMCQDSRVVDLIINLIPKAKGYSA